MFQELSKELFTSEHFDEVQSFDCGQEPYQLEVSNWLKGPYHPEVDTALAAIADTEKPCQVWLYRTPDDVLVGFGAIGQSKWRWTGKKDPYVPISVLAWCAVHKDFQGKPEGPKENRYSRQIMDDLIGEATEEKETRPVLGLMVQKNNACAIRLYQSLDFTDEGWDPYTDRDTGIEYKKMALILDRAALLRLRDQAKKK